MNRVRVLLLLSLTMGLSSLAAEEIDSKVIHQYKYVAVNYDYVDGQGGPDGHGGSGFVSYEFKNFLFGVGGGYVQAGDNPQLSTWTVNGQVGYVFRLLENHINIIPSFGGGYAESTFSFNLPGFEFESTADSPFIAPGVSASYAFNNYVSVNAGYTYGYNLDTEEDVNAFSVGAECAVTEAIGLGVSVAIDTENGFTGVSAGVRFHF
ncbi:MAG TPA: outer membrane beta-barrel protein [Verrucomicrobiae bacterium]|nr:outer membrane beta-barrel protein [Verrucomicrobiae bacterium]